MRRVAAALDQRLQDELDPLGTCVDVASGADRIQKLAHVRPGVTGHLRGSTARVKPKITR
jgi:hypothetical protein